MTIMQSRRSSTAAMLTALSAILYVAAVIIAFPLAIWFGVKEEWCAVPLAAANIVLALAMLSSKGE